MIGFIIHYYNMSHTAKTTVSAPIDSNNRDYDTCDECNVFREKKWKLCAKCGNHIEYFEDTRSKLNMKLNDILPINENVLFFNTLIIDVSELKLGHPLDINIDKGDLANLAIQTNPLPTQLQFIFDINKLNGHSTQFTITKFFKKYNINTLIIDSEFDFINNNKNNAQFPNIYLHTRNDIKTLANIILSKNIDDIKTYTIEYIIKKLIKYNISEPLCFMKEQSNMIIAQSIDDKTCKLILDECKNTAIPNWKYYTRDNFKFLDDIKCTLYYSPKFDLLYTFDELKKYFDVEFKVYNIKINDYSTEFKLRNIRVRILNEKFERLFHFADIRNNITKHLPTDFAVKEEHEKHHMMVLMYLLGLEKC